MCVQECDADFEELGTNACMSATVEANLCFATLSCDQLEEEDFSDCSTLNDAVELDCADPCIANFEMRNTGCAVDVVCGDAEYSMECLLFECVCTEAGFPKGECPSLGVCMAGKMDPVAALNECCDFGL